MSETVKNELDKIVSVLIATGIVRKIILFGSHAKGDSRPNSDIDLCILTSTTEKRPIELMGDFHYMLYGVRSLPVDLLAYNEEQFYFHAERPTSFEYEIAKNGVLIYEH
ncbi:MAG: nucleotidyltransferase domain-containing protein, partial [Chitinispirillales bacterium]|nr:nucleotidyltransferase domain-containing protein [Chitinispirillales bacterium]